MLVLCYLRSDFSVANVFENSHSLKPLVYKITGVWGNHEGSMLLWVLILSLFGGLVAAFGGNLPARLQGERAERAGVDRGRVHPVHPADVESVPAARRMRRSRAATSIPILQDLGPRDPSAARSIVGYVGFSISFSFAIAALIEGRIDAAWARWVRPWTLLAWIFLTLGIAMGSYWAYYSSAGAAGGSGIRSRTPPSCPG